MLQKKELENYEVIKNIGNDYSLIYYKPEDKHTIGIISLYEKPSRITMDIYRIKKNKQMMGRDVALVDGKVYCLRIASSLLDKDKDATDNELQKELIAYLKDATRYALGIMNNEKLVGHKNGKRFLTPKGMEFLNISTDIIIGNNTSISVLGRRLDVVNFSYFTDMCIKYPIQMPHKKLIEK